MRNGFPLRFVAWLVLALVVVLALLVGPVSHRAFRAWAQQPTADPQSLVGEWSGSWTSAGAVGKPRTGRYYLTIRKVANEKVHGKGQVQTQGLNDFPFVGTLAGDRLTFRYGPGNVADLTISGNQMRGKVRGSKVHWNIKLNKRK